MAYEGWAALGSDERGRLGPFPVGGLATKGMTGRSLVRHALWLPAELYLRPESSERKGPVTSESIAVLCGATLLLSLPFLVLAGVNLLGWPVNWGTCLPALVPALAVGAAVGAVRALEADIDRKGALIHAAVEGGTAVFAALVGGVVIAFATSFLSNANPAYVAAASAGAASGLIVRLPDANSAGPRNLIRTLVRGFGKAMIASGVLMLAAVVGYVISGRNPSNTQLVTINALGLMAGLGIWNRLLLAPIEIALALGLAMSSSRNVSLADIWARHPARWDPHGRFPLPGLAVVLVRLGLDEPALSIEATRIVGSNATRREAIFIAALRATDELVGRVASLHALAALSDDLRTRTTTELLPAAESAELALLSEASEEVSASLAADSIVNRATRLRAARRVLTRVNPGSVLIARHRPAVAELVREALVEAAKEQRRIEPVPQVYRVSGTPLGVGDESTPTTFKGRRAIFQRLETLLGTNQRDTVILHGPRRYGKTSLLKQLPLRLGPSAIPVFIDLQAGLGGAENAVTLLEGIAAAVVDQSRSLRRMAHVPTMAGRGLVAEPYVVFTQWLDDFEKAIGSNHVVLCLDEYEKLQEQIEHGRLDTRILDLLRSVAQHRRGLTVVLTGVHDITELPRVWASTLVSATSIELGPLEPEDATELVERPVPGFPPVYSGHAVKAILDATACHPFLVQVLCSVVVEDLNRRRWHEGDPPACLVDVAKVIPRAVERAGNYFLEVWLNQVPDPAKSRLRQLAHRGIPIVPDSGDEGVMDALLTLDRRRIVSRGPRGFDFVTPMFAHYVRTKQSLL